MTREESEMRCRQETAARTAITREADAAAASLLLNELLKARERHSGITSELEGWAVIHEEATELFDAIRNHEGREAVRAEAIQVGAMAIRFLVDLGLSPAPR